jgi:hypothetical protein
MYLRAVLRLFPRKLLEQALTPQPEDNDNCVCACVCETPPSAVGDPIVKGPISSTNHDSFKLHKAVTPPWHGSNQ